MLIVFEEHVLGSESDTWYLLLYQMTLGTRSPVVISRNWSHLCQKRFWIGKCIPERLSHFLREAV